MNKLYALVFTMLFVVFAPNCPHTAWAQTRPLLNVLFIGFQSFFIAGGITLLLVFFLNLFLGSDREAILLGRAKARSRRQF